MFLPDRIVFDMEKSTFSSIKKKVFSSENKKMNIKWFNSR